MRRLKTVRRPPIYPKTPGHLPCSSLTHPLPLSSRPPSVSFGGFGLKLGQFQKVIEDSNRAIELDPGLAKAYGNRGGAYSALGQFQKSIEDFDRAIGLDFEYTHLMSLVCTLRSDQCFTDSGKVSLLMKLPRL